jgi:aryl-alcohol dehydrogenase
MWMSVAVTAAVLREQHGEFHFEELRLEDPRDNEVLVRVVATGICHSDLLVRDQEYPTPLPVVVGHEGAGIVERVGSGVHDLEPGDHVVMAGDSCGGCDPCQRGHPSFCHEMWPRNFSGVRPDGTTPLSGGVGGSFFGQSALATYSIATRRCAVRVPADAPLELLGPLGCGVRTGAGIVLNGVPPETGMSLVVFGAGSVGLSAVMAARLAGCATIIAVDVVPSRLELALELGATHVLNAREESNLLEAIRSIGGPRGVDRSVEASGRPELLRLAVDCLTNEGQCGVVGAPPLGVEVSLDVTSLVLGRTVRGAPGGDTVTSEFIPRLIRLQQAGLFPFEKLITTYEFDDLGQAIEDVESGRTVKAVLLMPDAGRR